MKFQKLLLLFLLPLFSCVNNPYDTSTPEKFVISMGLIAQQPKDHNPLPYFYDKESADAILAFDQAAESGLESFNRFRNSIVTKFPMHVKTNQEGKIKIALDGFSGLNTRNFTYSASMIGAQMKERKPSDYEFISVTEVDKEGIVQLKVKVLGRETTLPIKKTKNGYRMFSTKETIESISKSIAKIKQLEDVFFTGIQLIESGKITKENFKEKMEVVSTQYFKAVR